MPIASTVPDAESSRAERITVIKGLAGQDDHFDQLQKYFNEMQRVTVETSTPIDFVSFAACAYYFGVIMMESDAPENEEGEDEDAEGELEEDTEPVLEAGYPESSAPTSPPASSTASHFSIINPDRETSQEPEDDKIIFDRFSHLSEQDKVLKWREAFMAKVEEVEDTEQRLPPSRCRIGIESDDEDGAPSYTGKDHISTPIYSTSDDPESFINWPEDSTNDHDGDRLHGGPSFNNYSMPLEPVIDIYKPIVPVVVGKEYGREYLEPDRYRTPARRLPKAPADPKYQAYLYEEAVRHRDELRAKRIAEYERKQAKQARQLALQTWPLPSSPTVSPTQKVKSPIGLIYLWNSQNFDDPLHMGECSLGFYIAPEFRKRKYLVDALNDVVKQAFHDDQCHRLQAIVVENDDKLYSLQLLSASGFRHEGTRRRAFFSPSAQEWKDVTYFAMLATEWVYDNNNTPSSVRLRTTSIWDEILTRHQRELDDLHRLEERRLIRSHSVETIRQIVSVAAEAHASSHYASSDTRSTADSELSGAGLATQPPVQRKKLVLGAVAQARRQGSISSAGASSSNSGPPPPTSPHSPTSPSVVRARYGPTVPASPTRPRKRSIGGQSLSSASSSSTSSQWEFVERMDV